MKKIFLCIIPAMALALLLCCAGCITAPVSGDITNTSNIATIDNITIAAQPDKMTYYPGESLNLSGLCIEAHTSDGKTIDVTKDCVITPKTHVFTEGDGYILVTISYTANGKTFTAKVDHLRKVNEYHENQVITKDYNKTLAVECNNGIFVGKQDGDVIMYRGIPYVAKQPTGENRFKAPVGYDYSAPKNTTVREAYYFGKEALQAFSSSKSTVDYPTGEDCLYLNVYANAKNQSSKKPVIVWIHGGACVTGGTADSIYNLYNITAANPDALFVSIGYRLSNLGFIDLSCLEGYSDEYKDAPNLGILDQIEALHWIYENIDAFGGDPDNITLLGESSGGGCVTLLPLIEEARPYISKIISQSGTPFFVRSKECAQAIANSTFGDMGITSIEDLMNCDVQSLVNYDKIYGNFATFPELDGELIPEDPFAAYQQGALKDIPILLGFNKDEGGYWFHGSNAAKNTATMQYFSDKINKSERLMSVDEIRAVSSFINNAPEDGYPPLIRFIDQMYFIAPSIQLSEAQCFGGGDVYLYRFDAEAVEPWVKAGHGVDVAALFGTFSPLVGRVYEPVFVSSLQKMWVQFAKTGNPSLSAEDSPSGCAILWPKYLSDSKSVMLLGESGFLADSELIDSIADWNGTYPLVRYFIV